MAHCNLLWIDLEMTGLDPDTDSILEIAVIATDMQLQTVVEGPVVAVYQSNDVLLTMNPWVKNQHESSGLIDKVRASDNSVERAQEKVLDFVAQHCSTKDLHFAGNSIYMDRAFLRRYMPELNEKGHYRLVDVSTVKVLVQGWYPDNPAANFKKSKTHRALDDIRESIDELRHYRKYFFR